MAAEEEEWPEDEEEDLAAGLEFFMESAPGNEEEEELEEEAVPEETWEEELGAEEETCEEAAPDESWQEEQEWAEGEVEADEHGGSPEDEECVNWDGTEGEVAEANVEADIAFEIMELEHKQEGKAEKELLARLRRDFGKLWPPKSFELEPFGSYVTELGLPEKEGGGRSDLDIVLLFRGKRADSFEAKDVRNQVVSPTIDRLGSWLRNQAGVSVTNIIRRARVPIVMFDTKELSVDISVQQPWGVLNSWHLRDLCNSGWPGRLRALARLVKLWAKSKSVHTAKDGALSSYGYVMLAASYLQDCGALPALLPCDDTSKVGGGPSPYMGADEALQEVFNTRSAGADQPCRKWRPVEPTTSDGWEEQAGTTPEALFCEWISWMADTVFGFVDQCKDVAGGCGAVPVDRRHVVSVRERTQEELRADMSWSTKFKEHWAPDQSQVWLMIEEPLNGENVARCVKPEGFWAIRAEVLRAKKFFADAVKSNPKGPFKALLKLPALSNRAQPPSGVGLPGGGRPGQGQKRPWERDGNGKAPQGPPQKRPLLAQRPAIPQTRMGGHFASPGGQVAAAARMAGVRPAGMHALRPMAPYRPPPGVRPVSSFGRPASSFGHRPMNGKGAFAPNMTRPAVFGGPCGKGIMRPAARPGFYGKR